MTAARLKELAVWAHDQSVEQRIDGSGVDADYLADLARCARAWATVYTELLNHPGTSLDFVVGNKGQVLCLGYFGKVAADTAIEAVEAAGEVKP